MSTSNHHPDIDIESCPKVSEKELGLQSAKTTSDLENDGVSVVNPAAPQVPASRSPSWLDKTRRFARSPIGLYLVIGIPMTAWWCVGMALQKDKDFPLIHTLVWLGVMWRLAAWIRPLRAFVSTLADRVSSKLVRPGRHILSRRWCLALGVLVTLCVLATGTFVPKDNDRGTRGQRALSGLGLFVILGGLTLTSKNLKMINWQAVVVGTLAQCCLGLFVLKSSVGYDIFKFIVDMAIKLLGSSSEGVIFLTDAEVAKLPWFLIGVAPPIIFFVAFVQLLSHWGVTQWLVKKFAAIFFSTMRVSGAEAVVAAASPFLGQGESVLLIRPYLPLLTAAEVHQVMASGFSTVAGSVFYAYVSMGIDGTAILSSCIMSIPASLVVSKLRYPETDEPLTAGKLEIPEEAVEDKAHNALDAFSKGAWLGLRIAGMILAGLLCMLSLLALLNSLLGWWGEYINIKDPLLSVQLIMGYVFFPVAALLGLQKDEIQPIAQLIGTKVVANEFVAYNLMMQDPAFSGLTERSKLIGTYALCGFGNLGALGIQIAILTQLAPSSSKRVTEVAVSALIAGIMATLTSACVAGMLA